jgi:hypothetical protein
MDKRPMIIGEVVQLNPETVKNKAFAACFMVVSEPKEFGAQGYVQALGGREEIGGQAYYRASYDEMEPLNAHAIWQVS